MAKKRNPLKRGYSRETIADNIAREVRGGMDPDRAVAAAYRSAREAWRARHPRGRYPEHLRRRNPSPRRRSNTTRGIRARAGELAAYVVRLTLTKPGPAQYVEQYVPPRNAMLVERAAAAHPYTRAQAKAIAAELGKLRTVRKAEAVRGGQSAPKKKSA